MTNSHKNVHQNLFRSKRMNIVVNGAPHEAEESITVAGLLHNLNLRAEQVAVEINLKIVDRHDFPTWKLQEGDKVEILSFIGGGSPIEA